MSVEPPIRNSILECIGNTPLIRLRHLVPEGAAEVLIKAEWFNPGGSVKDRIGVKILDAAERRGEIRPGGTIVEATSGNTGLGLAMVAAIRGYRSVFTMPDKMSREKVDLLKAFGAQVIVCPTAVPPESPESYYEVAKRIVRETPNSFLVNQYHNQDNPLTHYESTGPELYGQLDGEFDAFVLGMGTGGTISGVGRFLKERKPEIRVVGVDPHGSILKQYFEKGTLGEAKVYAIEGIGEDFIPSTTHFDYIDEIVEVSDREAFGMTRRLSREEGLLVGSSGGAAVCGALRIARRLGEGKRVVCLIPDTGARYLSKVHSEEWMRDQGFLDDGEATVEDLLARKRRNATPMLIEVGRADPVRDALAVMNEHNVSQLPVREGDALVGSLEEGALLSRILGDQGVLERPVGDVMSDPFPSVGMETPIEAAAELLGKGSHALMVTQGETVVGLLTRFDFIDYAIRNRRAAQNGEGGEAR
jgi:cystathionine beta-synthase